MQEASCSSYTNAFQCDTRSNGQCRWDGLHGSGKCRKYGGWCDGYNQDYMRGDGGFAKRGLRGDAISSTSGASPYLERRTVLIRWTSRSTSAKARGLGGLHARVVQLSEYAYYSFALARRVRPQVSRAPARQPAAPVLTRRRRMRARAAPAGATVPFWPVSITGADAASPASPPSPSLDTPVDDVMPHGQGPHWRQPVGSGSEDYEGMVCRPKSRREATDADACNMPSEAMPCATGSPRRRVRHASAGVRRPLWRPARLRVDGRCKYRPASELGVVGGAGTCENKWDSCRPSQGATRCVGTGVVWLQAMQDQSGGWHGQHRAMRRVEARRLRLVLARG